MKTKPIRDLERLINYYGESYQYVYLYDEEGDCILSERLVDVLKEIRDELQGL